MNCSTICPMIRQIICAMTSPTVRPTTCSKTCPMLSSTICPATKLALNQKNPYTHHYIKMSPAWGTGDE